MNDNISLGEGENAVALDGTKGAIKAGKVTVDGSKGTVTGLTNTTWNADSIVSGQAATEDQLKQVSKAVSDAAGEAAKHTTVKAGKNISVATGTNGAGGLEYTVSTADTLTVKEIKAGNTVVNDSGLAIKGGPAVTKDGIDAGGKAISNVADGTNPADAVNRKQLEEVANAAGNNAAQLANGMSRLNNRIERVGAGAAALAALHPQDYDPDAKWDFSAGYGRYRDANALAVGAFYRPNGTTMFSIGGSMGGGENMMNLGVTLRVGPKSPYAEYSKAALTTVIADQKKQLDVLEEKMEKQDEENASLKSQVKDQQIQIKNQQAQIEEILHRLEALQK